VKIRTSKAKVGNQTQRMISMPKKSQLTYKSYSPISFDKCRWAGLDTQWLYPEENNDREEDMKWCSQGGTAKVYMVQNE
jgi:hypothetical protein